MNRKGTSGFTLIEALLALAILALVMTVLYAGFFTAGQAVDLAGEARDETDLARVLLMRITDELSNAYYNANSGMTILFGKKEEVELEGATLRQDSLTVTPLTNWRRPETKEMALWEVGYFFQDREDGQSRVFMRREKRDLSGGEPPLEGGEEFELTDRVAQLQFRYLMNKRWSDEWDSRKQGGLPQAVEISLVLDSGRTFVTAVEVGVR